MHRSEWQVPEFQISRFGFLLELGCELENFDSSFLILPYCF